MHTFYFKGVFFFSSVLFLISGLVCGPARGTDLKYLSLDEKAGYLLFVGIEGRQVSAKTLSLIKDIRPAGVLLFKKNIGTRKDVARLTSALQNSSKHQLFIAVDQEGGPVSRIKTSPALPSARWVGLQKNPELTKELGFSMGKILASLGINMNLAPVLDVADPQQKTFLRSRSFSSDPELVAELGVAFSQGLLEAGIIPTAKHFPGLGSVHGDPHGAQITQTSSFKQMQNTHLVPFKKFSDLNPTAIMLSHASYPSLDSAEPATFSAKISQSILRKDVGFQGLIITDDLMMEGAKTQDSFESRVITALKSGSDLLLFAWSSKTQRRAHRALVNAMKSGQLPEALVNEKISRILAMKQWLSEKSKGRSIAAADSDTELKSILMKMQLQRPGR